jgi:type IV pilus assembly protein PilP
MIKVCYISMGYGTLIFSLCLLGLSGCSSDSPLETATRFVQTVKDKPKPTVEPLPNVEETAVAKYQQQNMRSPFVPSKNEADSQFSPDTARTKEPLEAFSLDALRMVGTLEASHQTWALIMAPDKSVYQVTLGSHLGQNYGRIVKIEENRVDIIEVVSDGVGGWKERPASLSLTEE